MIHIPFMPRWVAAVYDTDTGYTRVSPYFGNPDRYALVPRGWAVATHGDIRLGDKAPAFERVDSRYTQVWRYVLRAAEGRPRSDFLATIYPLRVYP